VKRAVFLDRDGVLNEVVMRGGKACSPCSFSEFKLIDNIEDCIRRARDEGFVIIVVTNQPDIARGKMAQDELDKMNERIRASFPVDEIVVCPHDDADGCHCRKPKPGMLVDAAQRFDIELTASFLIGDSWKDMGAAKGAPCCGILIDASYNQDTDCDKRVPTLKQAIDYVLSKKEEGK